MSPFPDDAVIEYPHYLDQSSDELKLEYAEKMVELWLKEVEILRDTPIYIENQQEFYEEESDNDNW